MILTAVPYRRGGEFNGSSGIAPCRRNFNPFSLLELTTIHLYGGGEDSPENIFFGPFHNE
jgi:hypothetical protein